MLFRRSPNREARCRCGRHPHLGLSQRLFRRHRGAPAHKAASCNAPRGMAVLFSQCLQPWVIRIEIFHNDEGSTRFCASVQEVMNTAL